MPADEKIATVEDLSERQREVLGLVAQHYARKEIASQLDITESGVKFHNDTIRRRLGVSSSKQAVRLFVEYAAKHDPAFYGQYLKETVSSGGVEAASLPHERTFQSEQLPDHPTDGPGGGVATLRRPDASLDDLGMPGDTEDPKQVQALAGNGQHPGDDDGIPDLAGTADIRRWRAFTGRMIGQFVSRSLVNYVATAVILTFLFVALIAGSAATMQAIQTLTGQTR